MDCNPLDLMPVTTTSLKSQNESEFTQPGKDKNNNSNDKNYNLDESTRNGKFGDTATKNGFPCDPKLMSCDKVIIYSSRITQETKTFAAVTSDPVCTAASGAVESQSVSSISEPAIRTATTAYQSCVNVATTITNSKLNSTHTSTKSAVIVTSRATNQETSSSSSSCSSNNNNNNNNNNNKDFCHKEFDNSGLQRLCTTDVTSEQVTEYSKGEQGTLLTGGNYSGENSSGYSTQDSYPQTKNAEISTAVDKQRPITEQDSKTTVIAPQQESSVLVSSSSSTPTFDSLVTTSSGALAVAPVPPRTTEGKYSASSSTKTRHAEIPSVCSGNESQSTSSPASEAAVSTASTATTAAAATATAITEDNEVDCESNVNNGSGEIGRGAGGDPSRESFGETQQKLVIPSGSDESGSLRRPLEAEAETAAATAAGQPNSEKSESIYDLKNREKEQQPQQQQQQLPVNKSEEEEEAEEEEKKENKEVLNSVTVPSPLPSSSLLPLPPPQQPEEGGLNQLAVTTTATTTTTTTTDSAVTRTHSRTDEKSLSLRNAIVSHPTSDPIVSHYNTPFSSSCTPTTTTTASSRIAPSSSTPPSSPSSSPPSSSSSSSLSVGSNEQPLTVSAITSVKNGSVCVKETPPAVQNWDTTTATANANSLNATIVQQKKTDSGADTMCGPSKDKIMPNSAGETDGSATDDKNVESTNNRSTHTLETTTDKSTASPATLSISQTVSSLSPKYTTTPSATATTTTTTATATAMATKLCQIDFRSTVNVKKCTVPSLEELATIVAVLSDENPSTSSQVLHESLPSPPPSPPPSPSSTLRPSSPPSVSSTPPTLLNEAQKDVNSVSSLQYNLSKWTENKTLTKTATPIKADLNEGLAAGGSSNNQSGSDDGTGSQSSPNIGIDSPESFVALPQTCFESSEFEENTEDSNSNNSGHVDVNSTCDLYNNSDCAFNNNISLERRCESLVSENTCDMAYGRIKSSEKVYDNDDNKGTLSKDFGFSSKTYRNIYGPFNAGYNCTFSVPNKEMDILETSSNKISSPSGGFVTDLLRCTTAIADDHSYCWSVSKTQESESLLRDAHPCDDEISDSSSLDDIPDQQESLSFLNQKAFSKSSNWKTQNQKTKMSLKGVEKYHKGNGTTSSTTSPNGNTFTSNPATKFLVDLPTSGHDRNSKAYRGFDQRSDDERKVNGLLTPVKLTDANSATITSPKITPLKTPGGLGSRGSLQGSPKVSCIRIGTFGSISNIEWDENSDTSSSIGSLSVSDISREKFTYCRKVDFTDKPDIQKNLMSLGEHCQKSNIGSVGITRHQSLEANVRMSHILHDHDYCMRTTISPMKCELAKELLSGSKLGSCSSKFANVNPSKSSNSSSNSLAYSSSSSSSSSASYNGITSLRTPSSSSEAKYLRKSRNNSATKFVDSTEPLQESPLAEKTGDATKLSDPNCDAARSSESKLKITGSFQDDYVYFLNKTTRSRRRISHEILPDKNLQARNYSDIVIPHLTDADIEALKHKRRHGNQTTETPVWKNSQDASGELEVDNRFISSVLSMENLCSDPAPESVLPGLIDNTVVPDNLAANPEQYLTPEEMDILFNAVKEVESTNFKTLDEIDSYNDEIGKELSPTSMLPEDQIDPCLTDASDHKESTDKSDVPAITTSQATGIPVTQWSGCISPADDLVKSEVLTTDSNLLDLENIPISDINPMIGTRGDKFKGPPLSCASESLPSSDLNTLCANNSNSGLTDVHMASLDKIDLLNLRLDKSDLFPEPAVTDTSSVSEGTAPWIVTVTMFWNDLPAIVIDSQPFIRLVDIHKQILPAKDTGILKKRCQLLGLKVQNCTEFQRYFLVQYGRAYNSKSTLVISKDDAKILIGYYVNPPSRLPKGEGCDDEPVSPGKRITKTSGSLEGRIKKHGRLIGSRKQSIHKMRNSESQPNKDKIKCEKFEKALDQNSQAEHQQEQDDVLSPPPVPLSSTPGQLKVKNVSKERLMLSSSMNGKSRLRHKKINFLNLIRGETGTSSSASPSSPAAATIASSSSSSSAATLSMLDFVNTIHMDPDKDAIENSMVFSTPTKQAKLVVDLKSKAGFKNRISTSHKMTGGGEQDLGSQENSKLKQCNGRVGLSSVARDHTTVRTGNHQKKIPRNGKPKPFSTFSAVSGKLPPTAKWKNSRNGHGLGGHGKSSHLKVKLKSKAVAAAAAAAATNREANKSLITDKMQSLCPALLVYHEDASPQPDQKPCMQPGKLILSLYSAKNAKCIKCSTCAKVFSVDEFLLHQHLNPNTNSKLIFVSSAQSLRLRDDSNESHQLLWKNFMMNREQFEFEGLEDSRMSHLLRTAGVGMKVGSMPLSPGAPIADTALDPVSTEHKGNKQRNSSTYRVSARKRKQKQFYPIENYDFKNLPGSAGHGKDSSTLDQFGQWRGKARGAEGQSNVGCSPSKKALTLPVSGSCPSYCLSATSSAGNNSCGSLSKNVVTLKNEPELLNFTALENDEYM